MSAPEERLVRVGGQACRVWEKGSGEPLGFLAGLGGLPRYSPFLDELARARRVVVPSVPGFPPSYAKRFAEGISGQTRLREIPGAGHLLDHDAPLESARAILEFLS